MTASLMLTVRKEERRAWQDALARDTGVSRWLQPRTVDRRDEQLYASYSVESLSNPHAPHTVTVVAVDDRTTVTCTCRAYVYVRVPCVHAAIVLEHLHAWPFHLQDVPPVTDDLVCKHCWRRFESAAEVAEHRDYAHNPNSAARAARGVALLTGAGRGRA